MNEDGTVDLTDLTTLSLCLLKDIDFTERTKIIADVNCDGKNDLADLAKFKIALTSGSVDDLGMVK